MTTETSTLRPEPQNSSLLTWAVLSVSFAVLLCSLIFVGSAGSVRADLVMQPRIESEARSDVTSSGVADSAGADTALRADSLNDKSTQLLMHLGDIYPRTTVEVRHQRCLTGDKEACRDVQRMLTAPRGQREDVHDRKTTPDHGEGADEQEPHTAP